MEPEQAAPPLAVRLGAAVAVGWLAFWWLGAQDWIHFPFALEWQEAAMFEHASRVANGLPVYARPGADFTAFPYPPLFHWLGALAAGGPDGDLPALRSVSVLSTLAVLVCLVLAGRRRAGLLGGLLSAGVFVAADGWTGTWLLIARVDALSLALIAAALLVGTSGRALAGHGAAGALAGILGAAAVLAKQTSLGPLVGLVFGLCLHPRSRRAGLAAGSVSALVIAGAVAALERTTDGWFGFHVFSVLAGSPLDGPTALAFWPDLLLAWAPLLLLALVASSAGGEESLPASPAVDRMGVGPAVAGRLHPAEWCGLLALVAVAWIGRSHEGGYRNTLLPAALALSVVAGPMMARAATARPRVATGLAALLIPWLAFSHPRASLPSAESRQQLVTLNERLGALEGPVWQPHGSVDPRVPGGVHAMAIVDLLKSREQEQAAAFLDELSVDLEARRFEAIVLGVELSQWASLQALMRNYRVAERLAGREGDVPAAILPATGAPIGPRLLLVPR